MLKIAEKKHQTERNVSIKNHAAMPKEKRMMTPNMFIILWLEKRQLPQVAIRYIAIIVDVYNSGVL